MPRDAEATRRRILDAAIEEFSAHGIAGARVDRIAAASGSNKSLIYTYFGSKDGLFDAVFRAVVVQTVTDVPLRADDLPEYAARLYDQHLRRPQPLRIGQWDQLERGGSGMRASAVVTAERAKIQAIADAQRSGVVDARLPPEAVLELVIALSRTGLAHRRGSRRAKSHRYAIKQAVGMIT